MAQQRNVQQPDVQQKDVQKRLQDIIHSFDITRIPDVVNQTEQSRLFGWDTLVTIMKESFPLLQNKDVIRTLNKDLIDYMIETNTIHDYSNFQKDIQATSCMESGEDYNIVYSNPDVVQAWKPDNVPIYFEDVPLEALPHPIQKNTRITYTFAIVREPASDRFHIRYGRMMNDLEIGVKHAQLIRNDHLLVSGEIAILYKDTGFIYKFNLNSSKMRPQPLFAKLYIHAASFIIKRKKSFRNWFPRYSSSSSSASLDGFFYQFSWVIMFYVAYQSMQGISSGVNLEFADGIVIGTSPDGIPNREVADEKSPVKKNKKLVPTNYNVRDLSNENLFDYGDKECVSDDFIKQYNDFGKTQESGAVCMRKILNRIPLKTYYKEHQFEEIIKNNGKIIIMCPDEKKIAAKAAEEAEEEKKEGGGRKQKKYMNRSGGNSLKRGFRNFGKRTSTRNRKRTRKRKSTRR